MSLSRGLDHLVIAVTDLEGARRRYQDAGFTVTPVATHPWGTRNALVQFQDSFLELLAMPEAGGAPVAAAPGEFGFGDFNRRFLARHRGMSMLVFSSDDARADQARWTRHGLTTFEPLEFSRSAQLPDGESVTVAFTLAFLAPAETPSAGWFVCQQHYPQHFWKPEYQAHANRARAVRSVFMCAPDPSCLRGFLSRLFDDAELSEVRGGLCWRLPRGELQVLTPQALCERVPGVDPGTLDDGPRFAAALLETGPGSSVTGQHATRDGERWLGAADNEGFSLGFTA
jgi:hypothetical protein